MLNIRPILNTPKPLCTIRSYIVGILCLGFALFIISTSIKAQEDVKEGEKTIKKQKVIMDIADRHRERRFTRFSKQVQDIMAKAKRGEELSEEERDILARFKNMQVERNAAVRRLRLRKRGRPYGPFLFPPMLNAVDKAYYSAAEILFKQEKYSEVIDELKNIVDRSPDKEAVSYTHFNIASMYRKYLKDPEKAVEEYREVTGDLIPLARDAIVMTYEENGGIEKAIKELDIMLESAEDVAEKVRILNSMANIYERNDQPDNAIATLRRIPEMITYEEALKIQENYRDNALERNLRDEISELTRAGRFEEAEKLERKLQDIILKTRKVNIERKKFRREKIK